MSVRAEQYRRLSEVATTALNIELARLAELVKEENTVRDTLDALGRDADAQGVELPGSQADLASMISAHAKWKAWAEAQRRDLLGELARVAAKREEQLAVAQLAFGKVTALEALRDKA